MTEPSQPVPPDDLETDEYSETTSPEAVTFQVTFTGPPVRNTMRLEGEGELTFDEGDVIVEAGQVQTDGLPRQVRFMFARREISHIDLHEGAVVLTIRPAAGGASQTYTISFYVASKEDAHAVLGLLHARQEEPDPKGEVDESLVFAFQNRLRRAQAPATRALLIANIAVFAMMALAGVSMVTPNEVDLIRWGARFNPLIAGGQWWRILTPLFIHIGLVHLVFNMWALRNLGDFVERLYGPGRFLAVYFGAGLIGNIASYFVFPTGLAAGASGAIFGVLGALVAFIYRRRDAIPRLMLVQLRSSSFKFIGLNLAFGFMVRGIDNSAHLGGLLGGLVLGWVLAPVQGGDAWPVYHRLRQRILTGGLAAVMAGLILLSYATTDVEQARRKYFLQAAPDVITEMLKEKLGEKAPRCESVTLLEQLGKDGYRARARLSGGILAEVKILHCDTDPEIEFNTRDGKPVILVPEGGTPGK